MQSLPCDEVSLRKLSKIDRVAAILERRQVLRPIRDAKGDNRCFLSDWLVWGFLNDTPPMPRFTLAQGMVMCKEFYEFRRTYDLDVTPPDAILNPEHWDDDLFSPTVNTLDILLKLQLAARKHRDSPKYKHRSVADDRELYLQCPEKLVADFRLPALPAFLGTDTRKDPTKPADPKAPLAGCPNFWKSHQACPSSCNLHEWGPCQPPASSTALIQANA